MTQRIKIVFAFVVGGLVAWFAKPHGEAAPPAEENPVDRKVVRSSGRAAEANDPVKVRQKAVAFLTQLADCRSDKEEIRKLLDQLTAADIPALISELSASVGIEGLDYTEQKQMKTLLVRWHELDPEAAFAWTMSLKTRKDRMIFANELVNAIAEKDYEGSLRLVERIRAKEKNSVIPYALFTKAAQQGPDTLLQLCKLSVEEGGACSGQTVVYPPQFDFGRILDGLAEMKASLAANQNISNIPSNLLSEWAAREPEAAWAWLQQGKKVSFNSDLAEFFEGYGKVASPEQMGGFLASVFDPAKDSDRAYREIAEALMTHPTEESLNAFLDGAPSDRAVDLVRLIAATKYWGGDNPSKLRCLAFRRMSHDQRVEVLTRLYGERGIDDYDRRPLTVELRGLGHDEAEIGRLLPPKKTD